MNDRAADCAACAPSELRTRLRVPAMDCPVEERQIRERLAGFPGVHRLEFDLVGRTLALTHAPEALGGAREALAAAGFPSEVLAAPPAAQRERISRAFRRTPGGASASPAPLPSARRSRSG